MKQHEERLLKDAQQKMRAIRAIGVFQGKHRIHCTDCVVYLGEIGYCPLHAAAPAMLEALKKITQALDNSAPFGEPMFWGAEQKEALAQADAVIAKVKETKT